MLQRTFIQALDQWKMEREFLIKAESAELTLYLDKDDSARQKDAEMALSAALGVLNRHAHLTADASLQFAVANASLAVGLATGARQEVGQALDALDRVLEIWTFTPYTANHIQAAYTQALALTNLAFVLRSEERRVGKECRSRWSPYH